MFPSVNALMLGGRWHLSEHKSHVGVVTGQLVWRCHARPPPPSHHVLRNTCMQILPLVEMFCKWELQEDCGNLRALMLRFDPELELESHELGRSLLGMIQNDDTGIDGVHRLLDSGVQANPFDDLRARLAAAEVALRDLQPQVLVYTYYFMHTHIALILCN